MTRRASHRARPGPPVRAAVLAVAAALAVVGVVGVPGVVGGRAADPVSARPTSVPAVAAASAREVAPSAVAQSRPAHPVPRAVSPRGAAVARPRATEVLHAWDGARARAYANGDAAALRRLYVRGSRAAAADARVLRAYVGRGLRVVGMRMQVLALEVLRDEPRLLRVRVTDRLVGAVAVPESGPRAGDRIALPRDAATSRVLVLRRVAGRWRVAAVSD